MSALRKSPLIIGGHIYNIIQYHMYHRTAKKEQKSDIVNMKYGVVQQKNIMRIGVYYAHIDYFRTGWVQERSAIRPPV